LRLWDGHAVSRRSHERSDLFGRGLKHGFNIVRRSPCVIGEVGMMLPGTVSYGRLTGRIDCGPAAGELGTRRWRVEAWVPHAPPSGIFCHSSRTGVVNVTAGHAKGRHKAAQTKKVVKSKSLHHLHSHFAPRGSRHLRLPSASECRDSLAAAQRDPLHFQQPSATANTTTFTRSTISSTR
jgi:hypothetical protein